MMHVTIDLRASEKSIPTLANICRCPKKGRQPIFRPPTKRGFHRKCLNSFKKITCGKMIFRPAKSDHVMNSKAGKILTPSDLF